MNGCYEEFEKKFWNNGNMYFQWSGGYMGLYIDKTHLNTYIKLVHFTVCLQKKVDFKGKYVFHKKRIKLKRLNHKEIWISTQPK